MLKRGNMVTASRVCASHLKHTQVESFEEPYVPYVQPFITCLQQSISTTHVLGVSYFAMWLTTQLESPTLLREASRDMSLFFQGIDRSLNQIFRDLFAGIAGSGVSTSNAVEPGSGSGSGRNADFARCSTEHVVVSSYWVSTELMLN